MFHSEPDTAITTTHARSARLPTFQRVSTNIRCCKQSILPNYAYCCFLTRTGTFGCGMNPRRPNTTVYTAVAVC